MATLRQKKAAELVETGRTMGEVMVEAGYSKNTAVAPTKLTESKGWIELMEEKLPDDLILSSLREDIKKKPQNRKPELELAAKLKGKLVEKTQSMNVNVVVEADNPKIKEIKAKFIAELDALDE